MNKLSQKAIDALQAEYDKHKDLYRTPYFYSAHQLGKSLDIPREAAILLYDELYLQGFIQKECNIVVSYAIPQEGYWLNPEGLLDDYRTKPKTRDLMLSKIAASKHEKERSILKDLGIV